MLRGLNIDCGCFGEANENQIGIKKLIENIVLLLMSIVVMKSKTTKIKFIPV